MTQEEFEPVDGVAAELVHDQHGDAVLSLPMGAVIEVFMQMEPDEIRKAVGEFAVRRVAAFFRAAAEQLETQP